MKNIYLIAFLCFSAVSQSQNYKIVYKLHQIDKRFNMHTNIETYLIGNGETSIFIADYANTLNKLPSNGNNISVISDNPKYFKELNSNKVTYTDNILFKAFNVSDSIGRFDWKITTETKKILNYECQKATLRFRGRDFIVFFSKDIPISDGPLKFYGLPGLILEVSADYDIGSHHYLVDKLDLNIEKSEIANVFAEAEIISYVKFLELYNRKYQESLTRIVTDNGETRPLSKGNLEVLVK